MRKWIVIVIASLTLIAVLVLGFMRAGKKREQAERFAEKREVAVAVEVVKPEIGAIEDTRMFLGSVVSTDEAVVYSKIPGKVVSLPAEVGRRVAAGTTIAVVDYDQPGMKFRYYYAYAPIAGEISEVHVGVGDMVQPSTPIATVVKPNSVKVETQVTAEALAIMTTGMSVKIHARGREGDVIEGKVVNLPRSLSSESHLAKVEIKPTGKISGLRAGMFAQVEVPVARHEEAVLIPPQAVHRETEGLAVYVALGDVVQRRGVEIGLSHEDVVEVTAGLEAGDEVIVYANGDLADGIKINKKVPYQRHK